MDEKSHLENEANTSTPEREYDRVKPLPATPMYNQQRRTELDPISEVLALPFSNQLIFNITAPFGAGKTTALRMIEAASHAAGKLVVTINIPQILDRYPERNEQIYLGILSEAAGRLGVELPTLGQAGIGKATIIGAVDTILDHYQREGYYERRRKPGLLFIIDDAAANDDAVALMRDLEGFLFNRLIGSSTNPEYKISAVIASQGEIPWQFVWRGSRVIPLTPFTLEQTRDQLQGLPDYSDTFADSIHSVTFGLPAATARLWQLFSARHEESYLSDFNRVYEEFVAPLITPYEQADAIRATAILDQICRQRDGKVSGFSLSELGVTLANLSYIKHEPGATDDEYAALDFMVEHGFVSLLADGSYQMEPHLAGLLYEWNVKHHHADIDVLNDKLAKVSTAEPDSSTSEGSGSQEQVSSEQQKNTEKKPVQNYDELYKRIKEELTAEKERDRNFVGRDKVIDDLARYLCRQPGYDANFVFIQASAGMGKTALLGKVLKIVRNAAAGFDQLIVPSLDDEQENIIELETASTARLSNVRRQIRQIIEKNLKPGEPDYFKDFVVAELDWHEYRDGLTKRYEDTEQRHQGEVDSHGEPIEEQELKVVLYDARKKTEKIENTFYQACVEASRLIPGFKGEEEPRRIVLIFDTFDYPIRSNPSSALIFSEIMSKLHGQLFCLIAGRPPIEVEVNDSEIKGDLTNYLPDNLRDVAAVINLEDDEYKLEPQDIVSYYEGRRWFERLKQIDAAATEALAEAMATVMQTANRHLPVLLNLLESYAIPGDEGSSMNSAGIEAQTGKVQKLAIMEEDKDFRNALIEALLHRIDRIGSHLNVGKWAMLLMSVIDRGVSPLMLGGILGDGSNAAPATSKYKLISQVVNENIQANGDTPADANYSIAVTDREVLNAMRQIAFQDAIDTAVDLADVDLNNPQGATLVKSVRTGLGQTAYKLHDYVSEIFAEYMAHKREERRRQEEHGASVAKSDDWYLENSDKPQPIILSLMHYLQGLAHDYLKHYEHAEYGSEDKRNYIRNYQDARANQVYYGLKLAALRADEGGQRVKDEQTCEKAEDPANFEAKYFIECLEKNNSAVATTEIVIRYLWGKMIRTLTRYPEFGFGEVLLSEVAYYRFDQNVPSHNGGHGPGRVPSLIIPLDEPGYEKALVMYYAAATLWQCATGHYALAHPHKQKDDRYILQHPWMSDLWPDITRVLREAEDEAGNSSIANGIMAGVKLGEGETKAAKVELQTRLKDWWHSYRYFKNAYWVVDWLKATREDITRLEENKLLFEQVYLLEQNPEIDHQKGLQLTISLLERLESSDVLTQARVHYEKGFLYRVMGRVDWASEEEDWGSMWHYREAIKLLSQPDQNDDTAFKRRTALAYNGWSYVLALIVKPREAYKQWRKGYNILIGLEVADKRNSSVRSALLRSYSTEGEIYRLEARALEAEIKPDRDKILVAYKKALSDYRTALDYIDDDPIWAVTVGQQLAFVNFRVAELEGGYTSQPEAYRRAMDTLEIACDSSDAARRVDAYRRVCVMLTALASWEQDEEAKAVSARLTSEAEAHKKLADHYYRKFRLYYAKGLELAIRLYDAYNATRMTIEAIEATISKEGVDKAKEFYSSVENGSVLNQLYQEAKTTKRARPLDKSVFAIMPLPNRFYFVLHGFANLTITLASIEKQVKGEQQVDAETARQLVETLAILKADMVEERVELNRALLRLEELVTNGVLEQYLPAILGSLEKLKVYVPRQSKLIELIQNRLFDSSINPVGSGDSNENR